MFEKLAIIGAVAWVVGKVAEKATEMGFKEWARSKRDKNNEQGEPGDSHENYPDRKSDH